MKRTCCVWCSALLYVKEPLDEKKHKPVCSVTCSEAEMMFTQYWSDEEINRRAHYKELTEGLNDEEEEAKNP